jgi:GNAT superfamily N-acetyltransferase
MEFEGVLKDGTRVLFRPIQASDKEALQHGFIQLSPESRYRRFFRHIDRLSDEQLRYLTEVDYVNHYAWLAFAVDLPGAPGLGVGRWIRIPGDPEVAEAAITVIDQYQHMGVGSRLLHLSVRSAVEQGIKKIRVWVQGENQPMLQLLAEIGIHADRWESGVAEIDIPLPANVDDVDHSPTAALVKAVASGTLKVELDRDSDFGVRIKGPPK